ncbi:MAG: transglycosylase SLT domain-containing protein [Lachnospirales bacterium]
MKLQSGGEPKRVRYISAPSRNINRGTGDPDRVTSVGDEIAKAREWEANWYRGRKATGKFEDQLDDTTYNFMIDRITNSPITVRDGASYRADGANGVTTIKDGEAIITANADPTYERKAESFGNTLGSILTHELDHAATIKDMNVWGQTQEEFDKNSIKSATPSLIKVNDIIKGGIFKGGNNNYINNAAEVKARLNSMRRDAKMDPARTDYKYKDYKYWLDKYGLDYGKEKSELLMNTVAQAQPTNNGTLFAQEGTVLRQDNTRVAKPVIPELIKAKPRQYYITDLGGEPSTDNRTAAERNRDYWHPFKGAKERFKSSMRNGTNPLVGLERTIMPAMAGAALVTTPATVVGGILGSEAVNNATGGFGQWLEGKVGIPAEIGEYLNPGAVYGGGKGLNITKNKLATKFIKGDADLGWSALNKDHWVFNKEARTPTNMAMASINRVMPFLSNVEKTPARVAAYKVGRRTKGNASVSLKDIKNNDSTYTGSATPEGNNGDRDLLGLYLFQNDPLISRSPWFQRIAKSFKPAKGQGFNYDKRYSELYPGIEGRRYQMQSVVKSGHPLRFNNVDEFNNYSNGIGKLQGKEGDMVIEMPDGFQTFRQPGTNYVGPIDDVGGHVIKIDYNKKGKLTQISQDMWKFNPRDYAKRWSGDNVAEGVRATKQAALMDKVGTPFILQQENPIYIGSRRVWDSIRSIPKNPYIRRQPLMQGALLTMKKGGSLVSDGRRFKFKDSPLVRNSRTLNNKRDMRKKFMKSDRPTYSTNRVRKGQDGLQFVSYTPVETPDIPKFESSDVFSTYNIPIVRDESVVSQPKVDEPRIDEPIIESAVNTPMKRELFNIKPSKGLDEFNKWYDEVEKEDPEAKHYRQFLTKMAEQESGFNSAIQNRAGAPAYGYFQFMQDGKKYNNITAYAGTDIETFRNNPKLQIKAAIKLAKSFERGFNKKDLELAAQKGYTKFGLLGGAWLAGNGGVRKYLQGLANPSDRHWSKSGSGTDVASRIQMFNF